MKGIRLAGLLCLSTCPGCDDGERTGLILVVMSNLKIPGEISVLTVSVDSGGPKAVTLGQEAGRVAFPVKVGIDRSPADAPDVTVRLVLANAATEVLTRDLVATVEPGIVRTINVSLDRDCAKATCLSGTTCVPGWGCVRPQVGLDGEPRDPPAGPACDCNSYFPICLGATWAYETWLAGVRKPPKTWVVSDHARLLDPGTGGASNGFLQLRHDDEDNSRRWMARAGTQIQWRVDYRFDENWRPTRNRAYIPAKLRLDEGRTSIGTTWNADYSQDEGMPGQARNLCSHSDNWEVLDPATVPDAPTRFGPLLCHRRWDKVVEADRNRPECRSSPDDDKTFCFARGVGKVLETGVGMETESLADYFIPGCGAAPKT